MRQRLWGLGYASPIGLAGLAVAFDGSGPRRWCPSLRRTTAGPARLTAFASQLDLTFGRMESVDGYMGRLVEVWCSLWLESGGLLAVASGLGAEPGPQRVWRRERVEPWTEAVREAIEVARFVEELPSAAVPLARSRRWWSGCACPRPTTN